MCPWKPKQFRPPGFKTREERTRAYETTAERKADKAFYNSALWKRFRRCYIATHPFCVECGKEGLLVPTEHVDHVVDRKAAPARAFDEENLQALCAQHHSQKTAREHPMRR